MRGHAVDGTGRPAKLIATLCFGALILGSGPAPAQDEPAAITETQVQQIESVIRDFLLRNPEVVMEALRILEDRQRTAETEKQRQAVADNRAVLLDDPSSPVMGNPEGDVVVVEFFDYQCGYCKRMFGPLMDEVQRDGKVKLVMKEFPILGPVSVVAARAALAAREQGKYREMHTALMELHGQLTEDAVYAVAEDVGLDVDQLKKDMESAEIADILQANYDLSEQLDIRGTPAFVIGDELVPGAISKEALADLIAQSRARAS
jgi:protein-disulfide isomerase